MKLRSERCRFCSSCAINAKRSSASRSILNGRPRWLQDNFGQSGRDLRRAIEQCHAEQVGKVVFAETNGCLSKL